MSGNRSVLAVKIIILALAVAHVGIIAYGAYRAYQSGQLQGYIDFPVGGEITGEELVVDYPAFVKSGETVTADLKVFVASNYSAAWYGGGSGYWVPFTSVPAQVPVAGTELTVNPNYTDQGVALSWMGQDRAIAKGETATFERANSDYLSGVVERVEISVTDEGAFTSLLLTEEPLQLNSPALYLHVSEYRPALELNLWPVLALTLLIVVFIVVQKSNLGRKRQGT